jgi:propionyl-CoA carboxylase alpha chain
VVHRFEVPGVGVRVDAGVADGSVVGVHYDPLLAKIVAHAPTREEAARVLAAALSGARLHGIVTNRDLLVGVLRSAAFLSGETDTAFLDRHPPAELTAAGGSAGGRGGVVGPAELSAVRLHAAAAALAAQTERRATAAVYPAVPSGWRNNPSQLQRVALEVARPPDPGPGVSVAYRFDRTGALAALEVDGDPVPGPRLWRCAPDPAHPPGLGGEATRTWLVDLEVGGVRRRFEVHQVGDTAYVDSPLGHTELQGLWTGDSPDPGVGLPSRSGAPETGGFGSGTPGVGGPGSGAPGAGAGGAAADGVTVAPLPGVVRRVAVRVGDRVDAGAVLVVVEAMKTEHRIAAGRAGRVRRVLVAEGQEVAAGTTVVELEEAADG